jgi:hypothetical protein
MPTDDYWEKDELQDRRYYDRRREARTGGRFYWPLVLRRSKVTPLVSCFGLLLVLWWWVSSGEHHTNVDWSRFAYSQYTTDTQSLCNALMVFESLHKLGSKADRVLLYPQEWTEGNQDPRTAWLMQEAKQKFRVKLQAVELLGADSKTDGKAESPGTLDKPSDWNLSITKIRVFELIQYDRVLHLDSDITLLQHMDELFSMPKTPIAMPRAYWSDGPASLWQLTSLIMLVEPNTHEIPAMMDILREWQSQPDYARSKKYDMDLLNHRFGASAMVLPHRPYTILTAEFRSHNHSTYLGNRNGHDSDPRGQWDADKALKEAKLVHFSDWPLPKPWTMWSAEALGEMQPDCGGDKKKSCREREIWKKLYDDFRRKRKDICKILSVPAPDWKSWKKTVGAGDSDALEPGRTAATAQNSTQRLP